jgi:hypothetical protein
LGSQKCDIQKRIFRKFDHPDLGAVKKISQDDFETNGERDDGKDKTGNCHEEAEDTVENIFK